MLSVLISFVYMGLTTFLWGFGIRLLVKRYLDFTISETVSIQLAGLATITVYAGFFSLFGPVGAGANLLLLAVCIAVASLGRQQLNAFWKEKRKELTPIKAGLLLLLLLVMAYGTSRGYLHFDTGLYHAQSIRWIEEYGVVPGLVNLHSRLAYNSSAFVLTALYSGVFLTGRSLHTVAGFLALLLAVKGFSFRGLGRGGKWLPSDFVRIALLWYLSVIYTEMVSPASDYFAMLFLFYFLLAWVELAENGQKDIVPYCLLCVLLCVILTVKLSVAVMLLLVAKPALELIRSRQWGKIVLFLALGLAAALPWMIRNVILSGWLVYPFDGIDLFSFDWKIPVGELQYDAEEIRVYAKGMTDVLKKNTPMGEWLPAWFAALKSLEKLWVLASAVSVAAGGLWCLLAGIAAKGEKRRKVADLILVELVLAAGYLVWQLGSPLVRYGYLFILAFPFFTGGLIFISLFGNRLLVSRIVVGAVALLGAYKGVGLVQSMGLFWEMDCYVWQQDYYTGAWDQYELGGHTIYIPLESGQIGYDLFPSSPYVRQDVGLRGESLKEGFRRIP